MGKKANDRQTAGEEVARVDCQDTGKDGDVSLNAADEKTGVSKAHGGAEEELDFAIKEERHLGENGEDTES